MNATESEVNRRQQSETVARLLKEYADKLNVIAERLFRIPERYVKYKNESALRAEAVSLMETQATIVPLIESLTRYASQIVEHFAPEKLLELELKLRLRETEQAIDVVQQAITTFHEVYSDMLPKGYLRSQKG